MKPLVRNLRRQQTDAEKCLWRHLRNRGLNGYKFRRQYPVAPYVVDFVCLEKSLIVEIDGGQHAEQLQHDGRRTAFLERKGFCVLRFWNNEVLTGTDAVLESLLMRLATSFTSP
jgi:very-short-patch-repair endonuclease